MDLPVLHKEYATINYYMESGKNMCKGGFILWEE